MLKTPREAGKEQSTMTDTHLAGRGAATPAAAPGEARPLAYEAAFAVRQVEIGLASLLSVVAGLTLLAYGVALLLSRRYPRWLGGLGLLGGLGMAAAGAAQAATGFSNLAMTL